MGKIDIRKIITARLKKLKWSAYKLANHEDIAECSPDSIYRFLRGETDLNSQALGQVLDVLSLELKPGKK